MRFDLLKKHKKLVAGIFLIIALISFAPQTAPKAQAQLVGCLGGVATGAVTALGDCLTMAGNIHNNGLTCAIAGGVCTAITKLIFIPLNITSWIFGLSGILLDAAINFTIVHITNNISGLSGINVAWSLIRDLINFSFIFILLYAAVKMILGMGDMKKIIAPMVIAAVLINFSLFFAKVIIDTSNIVTLTFYNNVVSVCHDPNAGTDKASLSGCFATKLGVTTLFAVKDQSTGETSSDPKILDGLNNNWGRAAIISVGGSLFLLISTFVFFAIGIMLLVRFVTIVLLFIFSPLMVVGSWLPGIGKQTNKWRGSMLDQALFPPVFMLLVWVILQIMSGGSFLGILPNSASGAVSNASGNINVLVNFVIVIGLMISTLTISKGFSKAGGKMGSELAGKVMGGGAGFIGRTTIGAGARALADNGGLKQKASEKGFGGSMARLALRGSNATAKQSFDARGTGLGKTLGAGKATGKGGYDASIKEKAKRHEDFVKTLGPTEIESDEAKVDRDAADDELKEARTAREEARATGNRGAMQQAEKRMEEAQERINRANIVLGFSGKDADKKQKELNAEKDSTLKTLREKADLDTRKKKKENLDKEIASKKKEMTEAIIKAQVAGNTEIDAKQKEIAQKEAELEKTLAEGGEGGLLKSQITEKEAEIASKKEETVKAVEVIQGAMGLEISKKQEELDTTEETIAVIEKELKSVGARFDEEVGSIGKVKGLGDKRKEGYIETLLNDPKGDNWVLGEYNKPSFNRSFIFGGAIKRSNKLAVANMRKGKKSVDDRLKEILKDEGELKDKDEEKKEEPKADASASAGGESKPETPKA